jgi:hypothetical protein
VAALRVFGDTDTIAMTFSYDDVEHAMVVRVDLCQDPVALNVVATRDATAALADIQLAGAGPGRRPEGGSVASSSVAPQRSIDGRQARYAATSVATAVPAHQ